MRPRRRASAPAICLLAWASSNYGYSFPGSPGEVGVRTSPGQLQAAIVTAPPLSPVPRPEPPAPHIVVADPAGHVISTIPWAALIATIHKRQWWNLLVGNPAGYLPDNAGVERIELELAPNEYRSRHTIQI